MWPESATLSDFLARAARRVRLIAAAEGAAIGLALAFAIGAVAIIASGRDAAGAVFAVIAAIAGILAGSWWAVARAPAAAHLVERRAPQCRNIVLTAAELLASPRSVPAAIRARILDEAASMVRTLDLAVLFPARRAALALGATVLSWFAASGAVLLFPQPVPGASPFADPSSAAPAIAGIEATITPPAYTGRAPEQVNEPTRIEALAGSRIRVTVRARASVVTLETITGRDTLIRDGAVFTGEVVADADGYIAIEATAASGQGGRRLIGVTASPDRSPSVRITAPGRDLTLADGGRTIDVAVEATDDIGLGALALTFTHVSGSGEQHAFRDGVVPLVIARASAAAWRARGALRLDTLRLEPGDMVVYRAAARDRRPDAPAAESDAFIVEIAAPGDIPAEGFSSDDDDRYALSQQMVLVKTERLIARAASLPPDSLSSEAALIAAEQRSVRAEFVFMMGGELAEEIVAEASMDDLDEAAHAELDDEAIAGRLVNRGRIELLRAIRSMSRAHAALLEVDLARARAEERNAIDQLQQAFARTRYILRALTLRERLDLDRRLTGDLAGVGRATRPAVDAAASSRVVALRRSLAEVAALTGLAGARRERSAASGRLRSGGESQGRRAGDEVAGLAARAAIAVLRIDPSAESLQSIAGDLDAAAAELAAGNRVRAFALLDRAAVGLAEGVRAELGRAPTGLPHWEAARLHGALTDALRRRP